LKKNGRLSVDVIICSHALKNTVIWAVYLSIRFIAVCYT